MIDFIKTHWEDILAVYGAVVAISTVIVKYTPTKKDDELLAKIIKILDYFSTAFTKKDAEKLKSEDVK